MKRIWSILKKNEIDTVVLDTGISGIFSAAVSINENGSFKQHRVQSISENYRDEYGNLSFGFTNIDPVKIFCNLTRETTKNGYTAKILGECK